MTKSYSSLEGSNNQLARITLYCGINYLCAHSFMLPKILKISVRGKRRFNEPQAISREIKVLLRPTNTFYKEKDRWFNPTKTSRRTLSQF